MTQEANSTFTPDAKKAGDLIRSQDWNAAMSEIARLNVAKLNRLGDAQFAGSLTVQAGLQVQGNLSVPNGSLSLGAANPVKKLQIEGGELRVQASHNTTTPDIATFLSQNLTQGIGIGFNSITAIGSNPDQDIILAPKGKGSLTVSGNLKVSGTILQQAWQDANMGNNWVNASADHYKAGYLKDSMGFVHLRGMICTSTEYGKTQSWIFALPEGYRPTKTVGIRIGSPSPNAMGYLVIATDGSVMLTSNNLTSTFWFSLEGVIFSTF
jgi:hypothetical protein